MLIFRNFIIVILLLVLAAISVVGIMIEAPPIELLNYTPYRIHALGRSVLEVMRPGNLLFYIWIAIFLASVLVLLMTVARPRRRMKIEVQMGGGRVVIMDAAIKKYIRNALSEINEVTVKKIDLREQRGLVTTDIYADVRTRENLPVLERRIIGRVRSALAEDLGITNLGDVHVYIRNFEVTGRPITPAPAPAKQPESSTDEAVEEPVTTTPASEVGPAEAEARNEAAVPSTAAIAAGSATATTGVLSEPIEPPGAAEPIKLTDTDEEEAPAGSASTTVDSSAPLAFSPGEEDKEKVSLEGGDAKPSHQDDVDEPMPWVTYQSTESTREEKDEDKDKPAL